MPFMCKTGYESGVRPLCDFHLACTAVPGYDRSSQVKVSHFEVRLRPDTNPEYALSDFHFEVRLRPDTNPEYA